ncbi:unnamed protein product, partial [Polarella glacialis]
SNIYDKDRAGAAASAAVAATSAAAPGPPPPPPPPSVSDEAKTKNAVGELNLLASLLGHVAPVGNDTFKLESLFGQDMFAKDSGSKAV